MGGCQTEKVEFPYIYIFFFEQFNMPRDGSRSQVDNTQRLTKQTLARLLTKYVVIKVKSEELGCVYPTI
jgi:hypothetical protein